MDEEVQTDKLLYSLDDMTTKNLAHLQWFQCQVKQFTTNWDDFPKQSLDSLVESALSLQGENDKVNHLRKMFSSDKVKTDEALRDTLAPLLNRLQDDDNNNSDDDARHDEGDVLTCLQQLNDIPVEANVMSALDDARQEMEAARAGRGGEVDECGEMLRKMKKLVRNYEKNGCKRITSSQEATGTQSVRGLELVSQNIISSKCPLMQTDITQPMKNKHCGHIYDKKSVKMFLKKQALNRCPVTGCTNEQAITMKDLVELVPPSQTPLAIRAGPSRETEQPDTMASSSQVMDLD